MFLKRSTRTTLRRILSDWSHGRRSEPLTVRERQGIDRVKRLGIRAADAIGWGQQRRCGAAWRGVLLLTPVPGQSVPQWLASGPEPSLRHEVLTAIGRIVGALAEADLFWPDLVAKHLHVDGDAAIGVVDLERLVPCRNAIRRWVPAQVNKLWASLAAAGATKDDRAAMQAGLSEPSGPAKGS